LRAAFAGTTVSDFVRFNLVNRLLFPELFDDGPSGTFIGSTKATDERLDVVDPSSLPELDCVDRLLDVVGLVLLESDVRDPNIENRFVPESFLL
jgi:hypothetical protein